MFYDVVLLNYRTVSRSFIYSVKFPSICKKPVAVYLHSLCFFYYVSKSIEVIQLFSLIIINTIETLVTACTIHVVKHEIFSYVSTLYAYFREKTNPVSRLYKMLKKNRTKIYRYFNTTRSTDNRCF